MSIDPLAMRATAVFSDSFQFPGRSIDPRAPEMIERDRLIMAERPGMLRKLLPLRTDETGVYCGGCYLFDTYENAKAYRDWVVNDFVLDGLVFLDRPPFLEPTSQLWQIVGFEDFASIQTAQHIMRFERWHTPIRASVEDIRRRHWPDVRERAQAMGLSSVWLLFEPDEYHPQLGLVSVAARETSDDESVAGLQWLESQPSLGAQIAEELDGTKVFDRTSWIYMVWFPISPETTGSATALWPCSPPLPGLTSGGVRHR